MSKKRILGVLLIIVGISLIGTTITGFSISQNLPEQTGNFLGIILILGGLLLAMSQKSKRKAISRLESAVNGGRIGTYDDLRRQSRKLDYELREDGNHTKVYNGDHLVTVIPRGSGEVKTGTYKSIAKDLYEEATEEAA